MSKEEIVLVEYVGKQPVKSDTVRPGSGRVWKGQGAVLEIPVREASSYLGHPTIWRRASAATVQQKLEADKIAYEIVSILPKLPKLALLEIIEAARVAIVAIDSAPPPPAAAGSEQEQSYLSQLGDAGQDGYFETRVTKIMAGLREMDPKNDEHYRDGLPLASAVQDFCGMVATEQEIDEAYSRIYGSYPKRGAAGEPVETIEQRAAEQEAAIKAEEARLLAEQAAAAQQAPSLAERAGLALAEVDAADKPVLTEMASVFGIEIDARLGVPKLREAVKAGLLALQAVS